MDPPHLCADRLHRCLHLLALGGWDAEADSGTSLSRRMRGSDDLAWAGRHVACRWGAAGWSTAQRRATSTAPGT